MIFISLFSIIFEVTPPRLRSGEFLSMIIVLSRANETLRSKFYAAYAQKRYEMAFTGQVIYLEHILNDKYDKYLRRIYITDIEVGEPHYIFNKSENNEPTYLYNKSENKPPLYLYNSAEYVGSNGSFTIHVPQGIVENYDVFKGIVDKYKLKSKIYKIKEF